MQNTEENENYEDFDDIIVNNVEEEEKDMIIKQVTKLMFGESNQQPNSNKTSEEPKSPSSPRNINIQIKEIPIPNFDTEEERENEENDSSVEDTIINEDISDNFKYSPPSQLQNEEPNEENENDSPNVKDVIFQSRAPPELLFFRDDQETESSSFQTSADEDYKSSDIEADEEGQSSQYDSEQERNGSIPSSLKGARKLKRKKIGVRFGVEISVTDDTLTNKQRREAQKKRCHDIVNQLLKEEKEFVAQLSVIVEKVIHPLRDASGNDQNGIISRKSFHILFSSFERIQEINVSFLKELEPRVSNWSDSQSIGDIFLQMIPNLKAYSVFIRNFQLIQSKLEKCLNHNEFINFLENAQLPKDALKSSFKLIFEKIPQYGEILKELKQRTPRIHPDHEQLSMALEKISNIATLVIDRKTEYLNQQKIFDIQSKFGLPLDLEGIGRKVILEGELNLVVKETVKPGFFVLFNDLFVAAKPSVSEKIPFQKVKNSPVPNLKYDFLHKIELDKILNVGAAPNSMDRFLLYQKNLILTISCKDTETRNLWVNSIKEQIEILREQITFFKTQARKIAFQKARACNLVIAQQYKNIKTGGKYISSLELLSASVPNNPTTSANVSDDSSPSPSPNSSTSPSPASSDSRVSSESSSPSSSLTTREKRRLNSTRTIFKMKQSEIQQSSEQIVKTDFAPTIQTTLSNSPIQITLSEQMKSNQNSLKSMRRTYIEGMKKNRKLRSPTSNTFTSVLSKNQKENKSLKHTSPNKIKDILDLLSYEKGYNSFYDFLKSEFSEENLEFWKACEDLQNISNEQELEQKCETIYSTYIASVYLNLPQSIRDEVEENWQNRDSKNMKLIFKAAQEGILDLMRLDSYKRFLNSPQFKKLTSS